MVTPRVINPNDSARLRVDTRKIWSLRVIAIITGQCQILGNCLTAMFDRDDVIDLERKPVAHAMALIDALDPRCVLVFAEQRVVHLDDRLRLVVVGLGDARDAERAVLDHLDAGFHALRHKLSATAKKLVTGGA